jgi:CDP-diacylglycerol pyrophosphatase
MLLLLLLLLLLPLTHVAGYEAPALCQTRGFLVE